MVRMYNSRGYMQDRSAIQHPVHLFLNCAPIINSSITRINGSFVDYCNHGCE